MRQEVDKVRNAASKSGDGALATAAQSVRAERK